MESSEDLFSYEQIEADTKIDIKLLFEEIRKEVDKYLPEQSNDTDSTDGVFNFLTTLSEKIQEEFDELLDGNSDKKRFLRALTKVSALILNTKVNTPGKIKTFLKLRLKLPSEYSQDKSNCKKNE